MRSHTTSYKLLAAKLIRRIKLRTWVGLGIILVLMPIIVFGFFYKGNLFAALSGSDANPAAHWAFDEGAANTCSGGVNDACDNSGNANDGAFAAAAPDIRTEDLCVSGKCLFFNGTDDSVTVANTVASVQSVAFWVKVMSTSTTQEILALNASDTFSSVSGTVTVAGFGTDTIYVDGRPATTITANKWHHVAVTSTTSFSASAITMGNISTNFGNIFFDELKLFTVQLSADQVKAEYAGGAVVFADKSAYLSDGLVGYWKLDEATNTTRADSSGNSNTLTESTGDDIDGVGGIFGNGGDFENSAAENETLSITDGSQTGLDLGNNFTLAAWIKIESFNSGCSSCNVGIIQKSLSGSNQQSYEFRLSGDSAGNSNLQLGVSTDGSNPTVPIVSSDAGTFTTATWYHVAATINGSFATLYVNGVSSATEVFTGTPFNGTDAFSLGGNINNELDGIIDEARVYSRALSNSEIKSLYNWAPGPVGYWKMDEASWTNNCSTDTVFDSSGNGYNGDACPNSTGPTTTASGKFGNAGNFDGSDDYVVVTSSALDIGATTDSYSVSFWTYKTGGNDAQRILAKGQFVWGDGKMPFMFSIETSAGTDYLWLDVDDGTNDTDLGGPTVAAAALSDNVWYHITAVRDVPADQVRMYINGTLVTQETDLSTASVATTEDLVFGAQSGSKAENYSGRIDEVRIYNYARTQQQIIEDMNGGHPIGGSPIASQYRYWHLNEGYGQIANDQTNNDPGELAGSSTTQAADPTWAMPQSCKNGGCMDFEATASEFVGTIGSLALDNDSFSLSAWAKRESTGANMDILFSGSSAQHNGLRFGFVSTNVFRCGFFSNDLDTTTTYTDTDWHHWICTYNATNNARKIYRDGILVASDTATADFQGTGSTWIGSNINGATNFFDGLIDEVKVYSDELTPTEVGIDMNAGATINFGTGYIEETQDIGAGNPPVGYWDMDEGSWTNDCSTDTVFDKSGNSFNADSCPNTTGPTGGQNSKIGKGGSFDGVDDYLTIADNATLRPSTFSISFWLKKNSAPDNFDWIIDKATDTTAGFGILFDNSSPQKAYMAAFNTVGGETNTASVNTTLAVGTWRHMAYSFDGSTIYVYENGILLNTVAFTGTFQTSSTSMFIASEDGDSNWAPISIDDIKFYDYARSQAQVAYDYNRGGPVGWWQFDENVSGNGQTLNDNSGLVQSATTDDGDNNTGMDCTVGAKFNLGCDFDGTDDFVSVATPTTLQITGDVSISLWVNADTIADGEGLFAIRASGETEVANQLYGLDWDTTSGNDLFYEHEYSTGSNEDSIIDANLSTDTWYHLTIVRNVTANTVVLYVNGKQSGSTFTYTNDPTGGSTGSLFIGSTDGTQEFFDGTIDDVRIFKYALSVAQVRKLYNNNAGARYGPSSGTP